MPVFIGSIFLKGVPAMAINQTHAWLIAYDIVCNRRRARIHKAVSEFAIPVQYSLYLALASQNQMNEFCRNLRLFIHPKEDDVRVYRVPDNPEYWMLGYSRCQILLSPDGNLPIGLRHFLQRITTPLPGLGYTVADELADETEEALLDNIGRQCHNPL
jgi:CRISPR-associated endonuclease Cas2